MMKIENPKYFFEKSLFSTFPEQNPVGPKVQLLKKKTRTFSEFFYASEDSARVGDPSELETSENETTHP